MNKGSYLFKIAFILLPIFGASAADREELLFDLSGKRVFPESFVDGTQVMALKSKILSPCQADPSITCIKWKFVSSNPSDEALYLPTVISAVNYWNNISTARVQFIYDGFSTTALAIPYSNARDAFGNEIISGDFIISMSPPRGSTDSKQNIEFADATVSRSLKYARPAADRQSAEVLWAGIYLNPNFRPGPTCVLDPSLTSGSYNMLAVVTHEVGRLLGLAPSSNPTSALYPICPMSAGATGPTSDDIFSVSGIYPTTEFIASTGSLSGRIRKGSDGSGLVGAQIHLVPSSHLSDFSRQWIVASAISRKDGSFIFPNIPPNNYLLVVEPLYRSGLQHADLDDWMRVFGVDEDFSMEFYDGRGRESNHEENIGFSPQSGVFAATLTVSAGTSNENVEVITNIADESLPQISAPGATFEQLSPYTPPKIDPNLSKDNQEAAQLIEPDGLGIGGCTLGSSASNEGLTIMSLVGLLALLVLRRGVAKKKTKNTYVTITRRERLRRLDKFKIKFHRFTSTSTQPRSSYRPRAK